MAEENLTNQWKDQGSTTKSSVPDFGASEFTSSGKDDPAVPTSKYYGIDLKSPYLATLKFIHRNGELFFLPYALQPIVSYSPGEQLGEIQITTMNYEISIRGRNLIRLAEWIGTFKVRWVKESNTGTDDNSEDLFVKEIIINKLSD
ncbi:hypothetical protein BFP97_16825 [Roseivirga sp. 4D4]|uniref:hypothetical protein n=1 Tax=Roseivirga sp. 4D4 TaxID=1889784 RepID=UPI0008534C43|nr:hypothetical protein [Roseivirga sp. 4D4]OEK03082.1 hypothetical protein BFP97_16825 [Roseivirga sp. 4D4]